MKAKAYSLLLCFCSLLLIVGLAGGCAAVSSSSAIGSAISQEEQKLDETVFPKNQVVDVKITIDESAFQDMLDNASAEEYHEAVVEYNGETFENVGIRTKGNLSLRSVVNMTDSDRYSFKISFDEYVNQTLQGISKINLNNNYSDASYMREFLSYELAESMGLPTPKYSYVNVYVNGELWGFYLAVEQIGDAYLERNFGNSYGALYKANGGTGSELNWLETIETYIGLDMKSDKSNNDILLEMLDELNNGTDYESVLDVEEALKFIALNAVSGNFDSYLGQNKHNYYLYEDDGIFSVLPWDFNMAFGGFGGSGLLIDEPTAGTVADRPLVDKLLQVEAYKETYHAIIEDMITGYLADDAFQARIAEIKELISSYVKADPTAFYTYEEYEQGITQVISFNSQQIASIAQQLDGTAVSSGDGSGSGMGMGGFGDGGMGGGERGNRKNMQQNTDQNAAATEASVQNQAERAELTAVKAAARDEQVAVEQQTLVAAAVSEEAGTSAQNGQAAPDEKTAQGNGITSPQEGQLEPDGAAQGHTGMTPPDGFTPPDTQNQQGGDFVPPEGQMQQDGMQGGGFGGQGFPGGGGMGGPGGMGGGFGGPEEQTAAPQASKEEIITVSVVIGLLLLSCLFITFYKRKRL